MSVIVPVYNVETFLPRCLDSLLGQTLKGIQIICVNDASPDRSIDILREYEARCSNVVVIDLPENVRQGGARNRGVEVANGDYVAFVDSDDFVDATMYEKLYDKACATGADVVSCGYKLYDNFTGQSMECSPEVFDMGITGAIDVQKRSQLILECGSVCLKVYKRSMLLESGIVFPEKLQYEDNYFVPALMLYVDRFEFVSEYLYYYCMNSESTTNVRNNYRAFGDRLITLKMIIAFLDQHIDRLGGDRKIANAMTMRIISNSIGMYFSGFDNVDVSILRELRGFLSLSIIFNFADLKEYKSPLKLKMKLLLLYLSPRVFKAVYMRIFERSNHQ